MAVVLGHVVEDDGREPGQKRLKNDLEEHAMERHYCLTLAIPTTAQVLLQFLHGFILQYLCKNISL